MWSENDPCYIIAEAGSNHNGDFGQALELINVASDAQVDAVKFQCIAPLKQRWLEALQVQAKKRGLDFLATPFDVEAVRFLAKMHVPAIKIASPEIVNLPLIEAAANTDLPLILSTGMASVNEIDVALDVALPKTALLQCTTRYPTPPEQANLGAMETLRETFDLPTGLSDHTLGIAVPIAAAALHARILEKHFTLDRTLEGPDHHYALEPAELGHMVEGIRQVEQAMGDGEKGPQEGELLEARGRSLTWTE